MSKQVEEVFQIGMDPQVELADVPRVPDHFQCDLPASGPATMMSVVLERSRRLCLQQYQKELFTPISYLDTYARMQDRLTRQQLSVYAGKHLGGYNFTSLY